MKNVIKKIETMINIMVCIGILFSLPMQTFADQKVHEKKSVVALSQENIQEFCDEYFQEKMDEYHVPGAAIAVVKGNEELLSVAYGVENLETGEPVTTDMTLFPAASVSKLFTATAVMQLYEQGKLDIYQDIKPYIPAVKIRNSFDKPITCSALLTHSSGLDEQSELAGSTLDIAKIESQKYYFSKHIPTVIQEPGSVSNYSNMGYNLLGYIVESISGQSYETYVEENILNLLAMENSSVRIPHRECAKGYLYEENSFEEQPLAYQYTSGSSGVITTVKDMEHFMIMHLNGGKYGDNHILQEQTQHDMQKKQFANANLFDGMGFGWVRTHFGNIQVYKHEGALPGYATTMILLPEESIGIYVATNSLSGICFDFKEAFMKHFYGSNALEGWHEEEASCMYTQEEIRDYLGTYRSYDGIARTNLMRIAVLFDTTDMQIAVNENDELTLSIYNQKKEREETTLTYCGTGMFRRQDGKGYIVIEKNDNGKIYAYTQVSHCTYEKVKWYESKNILAVLWIILPVCFMISIMILYKKSDMKSYLCMVIGTISSFVSVIMMIILAITMVYSYHYDGVNMLYILATLNVIGIVIMFIGDCINIYKCIQKEYKIKKSVLLGIVCFTHIVWVMLLTYFQLIGFHFL